MTIAPHLIETDITMILDHIKSGIAGALSKVRNDRSDAKVTTEPPRSYFIAENNTAYAMPAVFIIPDDLDFMLDRGQNHINAQARINVSCVVEDQDTQKLAIKSYRYQAALYSLLQGVSLTNSDRSVTLKSKVKNISFSPIYVQDAQKKGESIGVFRREVAVRLEVEHFELG